MDNNLKNKAILYRALNYKEWMNYVSEEYKKNALKNIDAKVKKQRKQVKDTPLNLNW